MAAAARNSNTDKTVEQISPADREVLRALAGRVAELAARDIEQTKRQLWTAHNDLAEPTRPLVFCDPENGWNEIIPNDSLQCTDGLARGWEKHLRKELFWGEQMQDDRVTEPHFNVGDAFEYGGWGLQETYHGGQDGGSKVWDAPLTDLNDLSGLKYESILVDEQASARRRELAEEVLGDLLPVRRRCGWYWSLGMTRELIKLRGLENMMLDMYDNPAGMHALMAFLRDGTLAMIDSLVERNLYTLNNEGDYVGSGGFGWTNELPAESFNGHVRTQDLWCLLESQETVSVSPEMFEEFIFPYQAPIAERFGRVCYGCCEPLHTRWHVVEKMRNLRRVSVSPWADREKMAENLGSNYVYSLKAHPGFLAAEHFEPDAVREDIRNALAATGGCRLEIIMKDNHTIRNDPQRVIDWVRIAREEIDRAG